MKIYIIVFYVICPKFKKKKTLPKIKESEQRFELLIWQQYIFFLRLKWNKIFQHSSMSPKKYFLKKNFKITAVEFHGIKD